VLHDYTAGLHNVLATSHANGLRSCDDANARFGGAYFGRLDATYACRVEVVGFEVDGTRYGLEPRYARIFSQKFREFARGGYAGDLAEIKRRTGLDAAEWLDGAVPLADRVDRWRMSRSPWNVVTAVPV
jgi:hypothetical protein